jgi:hypothetical protein
MDRYQTYLIYNTRLNVNQKNDFGVEYIKYLPNTELYNVATVTCVLQMTKSPPVTRTAAFPCGTYSLPHYRVECGLIRQLRL